jgi:hypothetical protein
VRLHVALCVAMLGESLCRERSTPRTARRAQFSVEELAVLAVVGRSLPRSRMGAGSHNLPTPGVAHRDVVDVVCRLAHVPVIVQYNSRSAQGRAPTNLGNQVQGVQRVVLFVPPVLLRPMLLLRCLPYSCTPSSMSGCSSGLPGQAGPPMFGGCHGGVSAALSRR